MQPQTRPQPNRNLPKKVLLTLSGLVAILLVVAGAMYALSHFIPVKEIVKSPRELASEQAKQDLSEAASSEAQGNTDAAITQYKEALVQYQAAGDKGGEEAVKLQIKYLESIKADTQYNAGQSDTALDPTASNSYETAVPSDTP